MDQEFRDFVYLLSGQRRISTFSHSLCHLLPWYFIVNFVKKCSPEIAITEAIFFTVVYFMRTFDEDGASKLLCLQMTFIFMIFKLSHVVACVSATFLNAHLLAFERYFILSFPEALFAFLIHQVGVTFPCAWCIYLLMARVLRIFITHRYKSREDVILGAIILWTLWCWWRNLWTNFSVFVNLTLNLAWMHLKSKRFARIEWQQLWCCLCNVTLLKLIIRILKLV